MSGKRGRDQSLGRQLMRTILPMQKQGVRVETMAAMTNVAVLTRADATQRHQAQSAAGESVNSGNSTI